MDSPSGWSYESWFTSNSGGSSWGNRNSKDTAVFMEGTRLEEPVLPLPLPLPERPLATAAAGGDVDDFFASVA